MEAEAVPGDRWVYETCDRCNRRSVVSFWVSDDIWSQVVDGAFHRVCTTCFDEMADERNVEYTFGAVIVTSWSQGFHGEWPHLDVPCAECEGRRSRQRHHDRQRERACPSS